MLITEIAIASYCSLLAASLFDLEVIVTILFVTLLPILSPSTHALGCLSVGPGLGSGRAVPQARQ